MKLLYVLPRTPWPPYAGQARLAYYRAKALSELGYEVILFAYGLNLPLKNVSKSLDSANIYAAYILSSYGYLSFFVNLLKKLSLWLSGQLPLASLVYTPPAIIRKFKTILRDNKFDIIHFYSINSFPLWVCASQSGNHYIIDLIDSMSLNLRERSSNAPFYINWLFSKELSAVKDFESALPFYQGCYAFLTVSTRDKEYLRPRKELDRPYKPFILCHNIGVEVNKFSARSLAPYTPIVILFFGSLYYHPNIEAIFWFVENVCPLIKNKLQFKFQIAGSSPPTAIKRLALRNNFIELIANPSNMADLINNSALTIAPMQSGSGQQFKVLESLAYSTPVVSTSLAALPLGLVHEEHLLIADTPATFAEAILALLADESLYEKITRSGWEYVVNTYSWESKALLLETLYKSILVESLS